jgi:putative FmdB family regulatory protein
VPTYEYACTVCAERHEVVQRITDPALTECPACGGALRKVFQPVGVVFKGSGFYKTDSRGKSSGSGSSGGSSGSATPSSDSGSSGGDAKGDAKPAAPAAAPSTGTDAAAS